MKKGEYKFLKREPMLSDLRYIEENQHLTNLELSFILGFKESVIKRLRNEKM